MRTIPVVLLRVIVVLVGFMLATASAGAQTARIVKMVGTGVATVVIAGVSQPAREGMDLPANAEVVTSPGSEVYVEVIAGVVSSVKPGSTVRIDTLQGDEPALELRQGSVVTQIDQNRVRGKTYKVKTPRGVAAARGTAFSVSVSASGFSITATADRVTFTTASGYSVTIQAGMILLSSGGGTPTAVPLASAVASNPELAQIVSDAVSTVATVVQNNLGQISADSATNLVSQVLAVAVAAVPSQATAFTAQAITAVTSSGAATANTPESMAIAAGAVTAAAVQASPDQASQIAGAAAQAAPAQAGVITAAAQQVAPASAEVIVQSVANNTGQSADAVRSNASAASGQAANAVNAARDATGNVVAPPANPPAGSGPKADVETPVTTPSIPAVDVSVVSRSS